MLKVTDSPVLSRESELDSGILADIGVLIDFEVTRHKRKVIILVPSRLSSLFLADSLKKLFLKSGLPITVLPFLGKQAMCGQVDSVMVHSMICEELGCPLKQSTRSVSGKFVSRLMRHLARAPVEKSKQVLKSTGYCPYYLQFKLIRGSDVIVATHGFATPSGIMFLCNILSVPLERIQVLLILPDLLFKGKEVVIDLSLLDDLSSRFSNDEIADLLLVPRFTLLPLPIDPLVFLALRHKIISSQSFVIGYDSPLIRVSSLESVIDFEEPYVFLSHDSLHVVEGNPHRHLERLESMVSVKKLLFSSTIAIVGSHILGESNASNLRNDVKIHFVQLPSDFAVPSSSPSNIHRVFRILFLLLRYGSLRLIVLPTESLVEHVEMMFPQCLNSRRIISPYLSDFELIGSLQDLFSLRKIPLLLGLDKIHQALVFLDSDFLTSFSLSDSLIVQIGRPVITSSLAQEYLIRYWTRLFGHHVKQQYETSIAQASLLLNYEIAARVRAKAIVIFDASSDWLPKEFPIIYHRSISAFLQSFIQGS